MKTTIDHAGRLLIPKDIRRESGIKPGMSLDVRWKNGVAGGRTYDAVIGTCAEQGKASTVLTFNAGDFTALGKDFAVVIPGRMRNVKSKDATP